MKRKVKKRIVRGVCLTLQQQLLRVFFADNHVCSGCDGDAGN